MISDATWIFLNEGYLLEKHILVFNDVHSISKPKGELFIRSNLTSVDRSDMRVLLCAKFPIPKEDNKWCFHILVYRRFQRRSKEMPAGYPFSFHCRVRSKKVPSNSKCLNVNILFASCPFNVSKLSWSCRIAIHTAKKILIYRDDCPKLTLYRKAALPSQTNSWLSERGRLTLKIGSPPCCLEQFWLLLLPQLNY